MRLNGRPSPRARRWLFLGVSIFTLGLSGAFWAATKILPPPLLRELIPEGRLGDSIETALEPQITRVRVSDPIAAKIVAAAHAQEGDIYDATYRKIAFPLGDVAKGRGACTDVVVRALRGAGFDLQKLIHDDMRQNFSAYPNSWGLNRPDTNIDHRRVPNHITFFKRHGQTMPTGLSPSELKTYLPGDIVCWKMDDGRWHTGVVSDGVSGRGIPLVIHNGWRCAEQDYLDRWQIVGHFRFPKRV